MVHNKTMESEQIERLALDLEAEEIIGANDRVLEATDIAPILEILWEKGADLVSILEEDEVQIIDTGDSALDS